VRGKAQPTAMGAGKEEGGAVIRSPQKNVEEKERGTAKKAHRCDVSPSWEVRRGGKPRTPEPHLTIVGHVS